jgi:hypothetical protein
VSRHVQAEVVKPKDNDMATIPTNAPVPVSTPRWKRPQVWFTAALILFVAWVAFLAILAFVSGVRPGQAPDASAIESLRKTTP